MKSALALLLVGALGTLLMAIAPGNPLVWQASAATWQLGLLAYSLYDSMLQRGWRRTLGFVITVAAVSYGAEYLGVTYGFLFGDYVYNNDVRFNGMAAPNAALLQPVLAGPVPLIIPFEWWLVIYFAMGMTDAITGRPPAQGRPGVAHGEGRKMAFMLAVMVLLDAVAATNLDLMIDPVSVYFYGLWTWPDPGEQAFVGIPLSNFVGWLLTAGVISLLVRLLWWAAPAGHQPPSLAQQRWLLLTPVGLYVLFYARMAVLGWQIGLATATLISFLAILPLALSALARQVYD